MMTNLMRCPRLPHLRFAWQFWSALAIGACLTGQLMAGTIEYGFAPFGNSYSAAMFADDPLVGLEITSADIFLRVESDAGSDAATFYTDIALPIDVGLAGSRGMVLRGDELGWSGEGIFEHTETTDRFNGNFVAARYGAATTGDAFSGRIIEGRISLEVPAYTRGDFDFNGSIDAADIDFWTDTVLSGEFSWPFDLDGNGRLTESDRREWVEEIAGTFYGDANLDGEFDSRDLVDVFLAGQYEDRIKQNSSWASGDWNGDADFDSRDFVLALASGAYEGGPRAPVVPEPHACSQALLAIVIGVTANRRRQRWAGASTGQ